MNAIKVLFLGSSDFSKHIFNYLLSDRQFKVVGAITKPDQISGRGLKKTPNVIQVISKKYNIQCLTPASLKNQKEIQNFLQPLDVDVVIVASYGLIIPSYFLDEFKNCVVNVHTSLLPRWRGASPIQHSLLYQDHTTGVSLQKVFPKLDTGDVIHQIPISITHSTTADQLYKRMIEVSQKILSDFLPLYLKGDIQAKPQNDDLATYAPKIQSSQLRIQWDQNASQVWSMIRAFCMNGGAFTLYHQKRVKIFQADICTGWSGKSGQILFCDSQKGLVVACKKEALSLKELQLESKKRQSIDSFIRGCLFQKGDYFE